MFRRITAPFLQVMKGKVKRTLESCSLAHTEIPHAHKFSSGSPSKMTLNSFLAHSPYFLQNWGVWCGYEISG